MCDSSSLCRIWIKEALSSLPAAAGMSFRETKKVTNELVGGIEASQLQLYGPHAVQAAMIEEQIGVSLENKI